MRTVLFEIGPFTVYGYGLMIAIGVIAAFWVAMYREKKWKIGDDKVFYLGIWCLIGGMIGAKVSSRVQLSVVCVAAIIFILLGIFAPTTITGRMPVFTGTGFAMIEVPIGIMFITLCGLCTSVMWGGIFNLAVEGIGKYTSMGSGIFMMMVCGGGILPLIQGYVADVSNYLTSYWVIIAGLAYMLYYAVIGSKNVNKDIPVD